MVRWRPPGNQDASGRTHLTVDGTRTALCGYEVPSDWVRTSVRLNDCLACQRARRAADARSLEDRAKVRGPRIGRPRTLVRPVTRNVRIEERHDRTLRAYAAKLGLVGGVSEALRYVLDHYDFSMGGEEC